MFNTGKILKTVAKFALGFTAFLFPVVTVGMIAGRNPANLFHALIAFFAAFYLLLMLYGWGDFIQNHARIAESLQCIAQNTESDRESQYIQNHCGARSVNDQK